MPVVNWNSLDLPSKMLPDQQHLYIYRAPFHAWSPWNWLLKRLYRFFSQSESLCICNTRDFMLKSRCLLGKSNNSVYRERAHSRAVLLESSCWWQLSELFISGEDGVLQLRVVNSAVHQFSWWKREFLRNSLINRNLNRISELKALTFTNVCESWTQTFVACVTEQNKLIQELLLFFGKLNNLSAAALLLWCIMG